MITGISKLNFIIFIRPSIQRLKPSYVYRIFYQMLFFIFVNAHLSKNFGRAVFALAIDPRPSDLMGACSRNLSRRRRTKTTGISDTGRK